MAPIAPEDDQMRTTSGTLGTRHSSGTLGTRHSLGSLGSQAIFSGGCVTLGGEAAGDGIVNALNIPSVDNLPEKSIGFKGVQRVLSRDEAQVEMRRRKRAAIREQICAQNGMSAADKAILQDTDHNITHQSSFVAFVSIVAVLNLIVVGAEVDLGCDAGWLNCNYDQRMAWYAIENLFTVIFLVEMAMRVAMDPRRYFRGDPLTNPMGFSVVNCADFAIVGLRAIDSWILQPSNILTIIKLISCLRVFHLAELVRRAQTMRTFRELWMILHGVWHASRVVFWTIVVLAVILYVTAIVMTDSVMKSSDPEYYDYSMSAWKDKPWTVHEYWGTVPRSLFSLFQIVTLDHWCSTLVRPLVDYNSNFMLLFIPFMCVTVMSLLNVIVAVIVESTLASAALNQEKVDREKNKVHLTIMKSLEEIFINADTDGSGELDRAELAAAWKQGYVRDRMKVLGLEYSDLNVLFDLLDEDGSGNINTNKFFRGCTRLRGQAMSSDLHHMSIDFGRYTTWCGDLVYSHRVINDRLAGLLADVEGLDRDIIHGKHDDQDPVLINRRKRYRRIGDPLVDKHWEERADSEYSEVFDANDGHSETTHHTHHSHHSRNADHRKSLVGITLAKTDLGFDLNEVRDAAGLDRRHSLQEDYDNDLARFDDSQRKPSNPFDVGMPKARHAQHDAIVPGGRRRSKNEHPSKYAND